MMTAHARQPRPALPLRALVLGLVLAAGAVGGGYWAYNRGVSMTTGAADILAAIAFVAGLLIFLRALWRTATLAFARTPSAAKPPKARRGDAWEYLSMATAAPASRDDLGALGRDGWELVSLITQGPQLLYVFKRRIS